MLILLAWLWFCALCVPVTTCPLVDVEGSGVAGLEREGPESRNRNWPIIVQMRAGVSPAPAWSNGRTWSN